MTVGLRYYYSIAAIFLRKDIEAGEADEEGQQSVSGRHDIGARHHGLGIVEPYDRPLP